MNVIENEYCAMLQKLEQRGSYETSARPRDISKLKGIQQLLLDLGNPHASFEIVHVAGTTGKGLTGAMLAAILQQEGFSTGVYSSPHIADIRERIRLNGQWISKECFTRNAQRVLEQVERYQGQLYISYFDILTALAFLAFEQARVEYVVLETGLGGKADSTNVTDKKLCILTVIGYDHINILGNSLEAIAHEKLGIVRQGIPTVLASQPEDLMPWLIQQLNELHSPFILAEQLSIQQKDTGHYQFCWPDGQVDCLKLKKQQSTLPYLSCFKTALMAYHTLCSSASAHQRLLWIQAAASVQLSGRLEYFENVRWHKRKVAFAIMIFDGGHNATALEALAGQLKLWQIERYTLVLGFSEDKLIAPLTAPLAELCQAAKQIIATHAQSPRAASSQKLANFIQSTCKPKETTLSVKTTSTVEATLEQLLVEAQSPIVVCGSFYLIGEFYQALGLKLASLK